MDMIPVDSTAVSAIGYDGAALHIEWKSNGKTSVHPGVSQQTFQALLQSPSKGQFIAQHIRRQHPVVK